MSEVKDDVSKYLRLAEKEEVSITRRGKPAGILTMSLPLNGCGPTTDACGEADKQELRSRLWKVQPWVK